MKRKYWFRARYYGLGWWPATWQGWAIFGLYEVFIFYRVIAAGLANEPHTALGWRLIIELVVVTGVFIVICFLTGEKPEWRWGKKKK